jgi:hypothetical protein
VPEVTFANSEVGIHLGLPLHLKGVTIDALISLHNFLHIFVKLVGHLYKQLVFLKSILLREVHLTEQLLKLFSRPRFLFIGTVLCLRLEFIHTFVLLAVQSDTLFHDSSQSTEGIVLD